MWWTFVNTPGKHTGKHRQPPRRPFRVKRVRFARPFRNYCVKLFATRFSGRDRIHAVCGGDGADCANVRGGGGAHIAYTLIQLESGLVLFVHCRVAALLAHKWDLNYRMSDYFPHHRYVTQLATCLCSAFMCYMCVCLLQTCFRAEWKAYKCVRLVPDGCGGRVRCAFECARIGVVAKRNTTRHKFRRGFQIERRVYPFRYPHTQNTLTQVTE